MGSKDAKLVLYTNHRCPWAHRAHIALAELGLPFEEVIIDLTVPRTQEYLAINPRGLVPALSYNGEIIIESAIVVQFLTDAYPSHLVPASNEPGGALKRAQIARFVDAYVSKVNGVVFGFYKATEKNEIDALVEKALGGIVGEVEPLLKDAKPFFGGSEKLTLAEVLTGSLVLRLVAFTKAGIYPEALWTAIEEKAPNFTKWAKATTAHPSVTEIFDEKANVEGAKARIANLRAGN